MIIEMFDKLYTVSQATGNDIWVKVFKNGPSKICGSQPLKI